MKGIIFTEFLEMVEDRFSPEIADRIIEASDLPSRGVYTAVGTYDHTDRHGVSLTSLKGLSRGVSSTSARISISNGKISPAVKVRVYASSLQSRIGHE